MKQPDLGTAVLVFCAGFAVIFFAGISWKFLVTAFLSVLAMLPIAWTLMYDYQRQRVLTLLDPSSDPLGAGFHTLQAIIAIGSGGISGKGWMSGTQAHLDFIPERTSDFLFAVYSEEFGFVGDCVLICLYSLLICRTLWIAASAQTFFERLLAGAIATVFLMYSFVNMGMVSGILPVVGVPLPFMSYGGTALIILGICCGILMMISSNRRFMTTNSY
jgi:rod shape determining protein RodA